MRLFSTMAASAGGLGVLLEPPATTTGTTTTVVVQQKQHLLPPAPAAPQIISKASLLLLGTTTGATTKSNGGASSSSASFSCSSSSSFAPVVALPVTASCSFLHRCFFCHRQLADGMDIYMYRGDRAFCSEECRCRHILAEDDDGCDLVVALAPADCSSSTRRVRHHHQAVAAGSSFTF